ncbi:Bifunctional transcriptional activator/DNA repair enzyme AdaA [Calycomorphotria hydatis]|uniref:Bifunctional transcriptional activator/DNA repair enzyme AdaA n=2 Tax=Calycomorphotria hydatis TaxID=2528027 RepID=A0A517T970_9PLAN|nr:Bifunctional transcriptional activator/DNA repair enzyme AdaA [Calycomorphotria hydatis]
MFTSQCSGWRKVSALGFQIRSLSFDDASVWSGRPFGVDAEIVQLLPGSFLNQQVVIDLDEIRILKFQVNQPFRLVGSGHNNSFAMLMVNGPHDGYFNRFPFKPNRMILTHPFAEFDCTIRSGGYNGTTLFVRKHLLAEENTRLDEQTLNALANLDETTLETSKSNRRLRECLKWISHTAEFCANSPSGDLATQFMKQELIFYLTDSLSGIASDRGVRESLSARRARIVVKDAGQFMLKHLAEPIRIDDLCDICDVSRRSLQYAFKKSIGLTPMQYLRQLRLHRARRALVEASPQMISISELALQWGFWHFGDFARQYKAMYRETPSQTLAK